MLGHLPRLLIAGPGLLTRALSAGAPPHRGRASSLPGCPPPLWGQRGRAPPLWGGSGGCAPLGVGEEVSALDPGKRGRRRGPRRIRAGEGAGEGVRGGGGRGSRGGRRRTRRERGVRYDGGRGVRGDRGGGVRLLFPRNFFLPSVVDLALGKGFCFCFYFYFFLLLFSEKRFYISLPSVADLALGKDFFLFFFFSFFSRKKYFIFLCRVS